MFVTIDRQPSPNTTLRAGYMDRGVFVDHTPREATFTLCRETADWIVYNTVWSDIAIVQECAFDGRSWQTLYSVHV